VTRIGLAGLGRMGTAIAGRLLDGRADLTVWNRSPGKADALADRGAKVAGSLSDLAEQTDIILAIVADDAAATSLYLGPEGLFSAARPDSLLVEMSTLLPRTIHHLGTEAAARSVSFLECPVLGTVGPARSGQLVGLIGGPDHLAARLAPVLTLICKKQVRCGALGMAARLKLSINDLLISYIGIVAEAVALGVAGGLDPDLILDTIGESPGGTPLLQVKKDILRGNSPPPDKIGASITTILKDMRLIGEVAEQDGLRLPIADHLRQSLESACADGWHDRDMAETALYMRLRALAGDGPR
jgi:3-hydroxyisobutyrate dehydrogenase